MDDKIFLAMRKMIKIQKKHKSSIESKVSSFGIHTTQHRVLMHLSRKGNLLSQKEIASHFGITPAAVTQILNKLECDGYIERHLGEDNRFNEINITELGQKIVEKTKTIFSEIDTNLFRGFSEEEMDALIAFLDRIIMNTEGEV